VSGETIFVGRDSCKECHKREYELWQNSHHDLAMQEANEETVLGNFENRTYKKYGIKSSFFKRNGKFFVNTEGEDGKFRDFEIKYTFGVTPLQQYLVEFPGGSLQVLPLCWDTRSEEEGGQRWFHIYADERIPPNDVLFWTRANQNWNYMCAECHSTNIKINYNRNKNTYSTTWSEIDVSCEACHGPGSDHLEWAKLEKNGESTEGIYQKGLVIQLKDPNMGGWVFDIRTGNAQRSTPLKSHKEIELCARCHARRDPITSDYIYGQPLISTHRLQLLEEGMYFPDGQIQDEVYVYGSFLQSKMYHKGVTCSDCHDPHSMKIYATGNELCYRCHLQEKFADRSHHFHNPDSTGALCVECHMPERTYMVIDPRRDHSIRIPRPDLSIELGTPNACIKCHSYKTNQWAADSVAAWYGADFSKREHYGDILFKVRNGYPHAEKLLISLITDTAQPNIIRATALLLLRNYLSKNSIQIVANLTYDSEPLIRYASVRALEAIEPEVRFKLAKHLLNDPVLLVKIEAGRILAPIPEQLLVGEDKIALEIATSKYLSSLLEFGDRPTFRVTLGNYYLQVGDYEKAEQEYLHAIKIEPSFVYAYVNLADLYRLQGRETEGERVLLQALERAPNMAEINYSLGLLLARQKRISESLKFLEKAANLNPDDSHLSYTYGIALNSTGEVEKAIGVLEDAYNRHPYNRDLLVSLVTINRDMENTADAIEYAEKLVKMYPEDQNAQRLLHELKIQNKSRN
jgi:tetratricopeptide (TPR) repeat protein